MAVTGAEIAALHVLNTVVREGAPGVAAPLVVAGATATGQQGIRAMCERAVCERAMCNRAVRLAVRVQQHVATPRGGVRSVPVDFWHRS